MPDPDRWRAVEQLRRELAERLALTWPHPDPDAPPDTLSDFVAGTVVQVLAPDPGRYSSQSSRTRPRDVA
jgi:hypothetical protein